jgi:uncharacterized protein (TIGR04222 family)
VDQLNKALEHWTQEDYMRDVEAGAQYLRSRPFVDSAHIAALGFCVAGRRALLLAGQPPDLNPYEVALLAGGEKLAVTAAIANLVERGILEVDPIRRTVKVIKSPPPPHAKPLEKAVCHAVTSEEGEDPREVESESLSKASDLRPRLEESGLVLSRAAAMLIGLMTVLPLWGVLILGVVKIEVGISRQRPVLFLVALVGITLVLSLILLRSFGHEARIGASGETD